MERMASISELSEYRALVATSPMQAAVRLYRAERALHEIMEQGYKYQHRTQILKALALRAQDALGIERYSATEAS